MEKLPAFEKEKEKRSEEKKSINMAKSCKNIFTLVLWLNLNGI